MAIISSISSALDKVQFFQGLNASSVAAAAVVLATSYHILINVLELDKPKGYRDIPKLDSWKVLYYMFKTMPSAEKYALSMKDVQEKYGISRVKQFGYDVVHVATPEYAHQVLMNTDIFPKFDFHATQPHSLLSKFNGHNIVNSNGDEWRRQRRVCNPAFHRSWSTDAFGERTMTVVNNILAQIKAGSPTVEVADITRKMTLDALCKIAFDYDFNSVDNPDDHFSSMYHTALIGVFSPIRVFFPSLDKIPFLRSKTIKAVNQLNDFLFRIIDEKREKIRLAAESGFETKENDLLSLLIRAAGDDALTNEELRANMLVFLIAGHDTTANILACTLYHIAKNTDLQDKLHAEITDVLGPSDASNPDPIPTVDESKNMELVNAIIKETMRINESIEVLPPRIVATETTMGPYTLPAGVQVNVNVHSIQHNSKYWDRPEEFNPSRFLKKGSVNMGGDEGGKKDPSAWLPFSLGSRICIGMNFSLIEQRVAICMLVHRFKLSLPADSMHKDGIQFHPSVLKSPKDLHIQFVPRY